VVKYVIAGGVVLAGGFAFWLYHSHSVAAAAVAASGAAKPAAAGPSVGSRLGGFVGGAVAKLLPIPGLAPSTYGGAIADPEIAGVGSVLGGTRALVTGHPITAVKKVGAGTIKIATAPVHAVSSVLHHLF
jgi:hypothetical protein